MHDCIAMGSEKLIANELLAFIQHAIDTMDEVSIVQICKSNFNEEEICSGKVLLYETLDMADRMPSRRRDEKGERSLQDIISLLKGTDPDDVPTFVAKELHKLPPVTFDHVDVTRLLKDIISLKASLAEVMFRLEVSETTIGELRTELSTLKCNDSISRSLVEASNVNTRRGAQNASISSLPSPQPAVATCASPRPAAPRPAASNTAPMTSSTASTPRAYALAAAAPATRRPVGRTTIAPVSPSPLQSNKGKNQDRRQPIAAPSTKEDDGFTVVQKKRRKPSRRNLCGSGPLGCGESLRPQIPVTLLYVSRLHWSTKAADIVNHVQRKTSFTLRVERLESRHTTNFNSFVVRVPTSQLATFMKEEFWPQGVVFRRFRGRLPADSARHTSPALRVT